MIKNAVDVVFGSLSYWMFGYALSFGQNSFYGLFAMDNFFTDSTNSSTMGTMFSHFFFQSSFATTATTIVSGALAERANFNAYMIFSFFNTLVYAIPAHWIWHKDGFLHKYVGAVDYAGSGVVHLIGGVTGLIGAIMLGPRYNRWDHGLDPPAMGSPTNAILGTFMLWWGWLGFNCGSSYGVAGGKWKLAAKSAVVTINSSVSGGAVSLLTSYIFKKQKFEISYILNGILGSLVAITAPCPAVTPFEATIIGGIAPVFVIGVQELLPHLKIDDPVGAVAVHGAGGLWSLIAVGLFADIDSTGELVVSHPGLFHGGGVGLLIAQIEYSLCCIVWTIIATYIILKTLAVTIGIRGDISLEVFGADLVEHNINGRLDWKTSCLYDSQGIEIGKVNKSTSLTELLRLNDIIEARANPQTSSALGRRQSTIDYRSSSRNLQSARRRKDREKSSQITEVIQNGSINHHESLKNNLSNGHITNNIDVTTNHGAIEPHPGNNENVVTML